MRSSFGARVLCVAITISQPPVSGVSDRLGPDIKPVDRRDRIIDVSDDLGDPPGVMVVEPAWHALEQMTQFEFVSHNPDEPAMSPEDLALVCESWT